MITFDVRMGIHAQLLGELHGVTAVPKVSESVKIQTRVFRSRSATTNPINSLVSPSGALALRRC
jgi:hypothetical protein